MRGNEQPANLFSCDSFKRIKIKKNNDLFSKIFSERILIKKSNIFASQTSPYSILLNKKNTIHKQFFGLILCDAACSNASADPWLPRKT